MILGRRKPGDAFDTLIDAVFDIGIIDYVKDGSVVKDVPTKPVMVEEEGDLDNLTGYEAGTIAFTAGFANMWQLGADGDWVSIV